VFKIVPERVWRKSFAAPISYYSVRLHCSVTCFRETSWAVYFLRDERRIATEWYFVMMGLTDIHCTEGSEECKVA
jgi:hypothetical protein